jgi:hypothetical protein
MALVTALLVFTVMYGATRPPAIDPNTLPFVVDPNQINFEIIAWRQGEVDKPLTFTFKVGFPGADPNDPNTAMTVTASNGAVVKDPTNSRIISGGDVVDTYTLARLRSVPIVEYIDVTVTAANGKADSRTVVFSFTPKPAPVIFVRYPYWLPHGVAWMNDPAVDPDRKVTAWRDTKKFFGGKSPIDRQMNDSLFLAWTQGKVVKP